MYIDRKICCTPFVCSLHHVSYIEPLGHVNNVKILSTGGAVLFQFDMGSGRAQIVSNETYNDGKWHTVEARRSGREGLLFVDGVEGQGDRQAPGTLTKLDIGEDIFIGGSPTPPGLREITGQGFEGCIKGVQLGRLFLKMLMFHKTFLKKTK